MRRVTSMPDTARHPHVDQHDVGRELDDAIDCLLPVAGLADDDDVGLVLEHEPHAAPEQRVRRRRAGRVSAAFAPRPTLTQCLDEAEAPSRRR